jgi:hypothetical protein
MSDARKSRMQFSHILLAISLAAGIAMIVGNIAIQRGGPVMEVPAAFSH